MRNWTIKDAVAVIQNGKDTEAIKEIAKHFPVFFMAVAKNDLGAVAAMMTDKMTVRRLQAEATEADEDNDEAEEVEAADDTDTSDDGGEDLESMSTKQLIALCGKRGIKVPKYGKNKKFYLEALQGGAEEAEAEDDSDDDDTEDDPYAGKNAIQLYSLCKKRGLKVKPKQKAAVYLEALKKADAAESEDADDQDQDDDWGEDDDEAEEKKPAKKSTKKAPTKKSAPKKAAKKAEPEEDEDDGDDDDDWEI